MGFRKTENGNVVYDFDFTPTKLVPLPDAEGAYSAEDDNGNRAPLTIMYQNPRHLDYGVAIAYPNEADAIVFITNVQIVCAFCEIGKKQEEGLGTNNTDVDINPSFDPLDTKTLSQRGCVIPLKSPQEAKQRMLTLGVPRDRYAFIASR